MDLRTKIAFAMWADAYPPHIRSDLSPDRLGTITTSMGDGWTAETDLRLDWELNRDGFLKLADIALAAMPPSAVTAGDRSDDAYTRAYRALHKITGACICCICAGHIADEITDAVTAAKVSEAT